jgi:hypothetical protein
MPRDIEITDVSVGTGEEAVQGKTALVELRMFLHRGEEVFVYPEPRVKIDLFGRRCIPGLHKGILGMRVGGARSIVISPHLAYGAEGVPGKVPPNALLRCEVELIDVREPYARGPEDAPPIRSVIIYHPGEAARNLPRWQLRISEDGSCGAGLRFPIPGMTWRHTRQKSITAQLDTSLVATLLDEAKTMPIRFPEECLATEQLWADINEQANSITRDNATNTLCLTIDYWEDGQHHYYRMRENSAPLCESQLFQVVSSLLQRPIAEDNAAQSNLRPKGHLPA